MLNFSVESIIFLVGFVKLMEVQLKLNLVLRKAFLFRFEVPEKVISVS